MGIDLDELERDALTELGNIGVGRATTAFSRMIGGPVEISVPMVSLVPGDRVSGLLRSALPGPLIAVTECLSGAFLGSAILLMPERSGLPLAAAALPPGVPKEDAAELVEEALAEVGNIVLNSCLSSMGNLLGVAIGTTLPQVVRGVGDGFLERCGVGLTAEAQAILFHVTFRTPPHDVEGTVVLALDAGSAAELKAAIGRYIGRVLA
ncbi:MULTISPECIES: chemotaxis protein CheC [Azospirillum]|nr:MULTISPECIES: chemotaxis protein CheC [Azospirillum]MDW7553130.1 chemotaxis protein CheC [Azospirillum brasilense]MDW7593492.1 chemotaxis protein CheC [Azospirillum brasilense]MDW7628449.1 chemotaxis protein CheC [Azospirillum brasilense]MDX5955456.1 chemotaxis protein CheC [Azospirillum brasilense]